MASIPAQQAINAYHREMSQHAHHGGHEMFLFHRDWHQQNRDPIPPTRQDRNWGTNLVFGTNFLQMHHEMVKAADSEQRFHMQHSSIAGWYANKGYDLPPEWNPLSDIPDILSYTPDLDVFPTEIRNALVARAQQQGISPEQLLRRKTNQPRFTFPKYFTREGVAPNEPGEPYTGARKLADFKNTNQLGCCIVFPHNRWHSTIGGAMSSTWTAIADPIFYLGVHWHLDKVFDEYKLIQAEQRIRPLDRFSLHATKSLESTDLEPSRELTPEELERREADIQLSGLLNQSLS
jgi:Common central domain of tyrosinase